MLDPLGGVLLKKRHTSEAQLTLRNAAQLAPEDTGIQFHLAQAFAAAGKKDEARGLLRSLLKTEKSFDDRKQAEKLITEPDRCWWSGPWVLDALSILSAINRRSVMRMPGARAIAAGRQKKSGSAREPPMRGKTPVRSGRLALAPQQRADADQRCAEQAEGRRLGNGGD